MLVYFLRHGIAEDKSASGLDDDRVLTSEGRGKVREAVKGLVRLGVEVEHIFTSPLPRARQTAEIAAEGMKKPKALKISNALRPEGSLRDLFSELKNCGTAEGLMFVGHEPNLSRMVSEILSPNARLQIEFKKSGVCCLEVESMPPACPGTLLWFLTPKQLAKIN